MRRAVRGVRAVSALAPAGRPTLRAPDETNDPAGLVIEFRSHRPVVEFLLFDRHVAPPSGPRYGDMSASTRAGRKKNREFD
ncbi:hypothetical protein C8259_11880 [Nocardia nova]|uniref:Uncharacterized protein n=1 Tax=Nocardia nova TaxID=37330 RepID=A0A2T2Z6J6_9NOCA|nr:hypothetical protein C8259_11880 [Nocardia nova]